MGGIEHQAGDVAKAGGWHDELECIHEAENLFPVRALDFEGDYAAVQTGREHSPAQGELWMRGKSRVVHSVYLWMGTQEPGY